nr:glycoside hydrolase family 88 protein [Bacillus subtilis]
MAQLIFDEEKVTSVIDRIVKRTFQMDFAWDWYRAASRFTVWRRAYEATENEEYINLLKTWVDEQLEDGLPPLSINGVSIGHTLLFLHKVTGDEVYLETAVEMAEYVLHKAPRFGEGILQHTVNAAEYVFPEQAWADTLMMAGLFMLRIGRIMEREDYFEDACASFTDMRTCFRTLSRICTTTPGTTKRKIICRGFIGAGRTAGRHSRWQRRSRLLR